MHRIAMGVAGLVSFGSAALADMAIVQPEPATGTAEGVLLVLLMVGALYLLSGQGGAAKTTRPAPAPELQADIAVIMKF